MITPIIIFKFSFWLDKKLRVRDPITAAIAALIPNLTTICQLIFLKNINTLYKLFIRCTTAVDAIAMGIGRNREKTGNNNVASPKPVKRVRPPARKDKPAKNKYS